LQGEDYQPKQKVERASEKILPLKCTDPGLTKIISCQEETFKKKKISQKNPHQRESMEGEVFWVVGKTFHQLKKGLVVGIPAKGVKNWDLIMGVERESAGGPQKKRGDVSGGKGHKGEKKNVSLKKEPVSW